MVDVTVSSILDEAARHPVLARSPPFFLAKRSGMPSPNYTRLVAGQHANFLSGATRAVARRKQRLSAIARASFSIRVRDLPADG
jgi:hypothetical protein